MSNSTDVIVQIGSIFFFFFCIKKKNGTYLHNNISAIAHPLDQINQKVNYNYQI